MNHLLRIIGNLVYSLVRGSTKVVIDEKKGIVEKTSQPRLLIKLLYWLAFQASFPYKVNADALRVAGLRRQIADILLCYRYGGRYKVASFLGFREEKSTYAFKTKFVKGNLPSSQAEVKKELEELDCFFQETGMPIWSIAPFNPKAHRNVIRKSNGTLWIVDLESNFVSPLFPKRYWLDCIQEGYFPCFDDICFEKLRSYIAREKWRFVRSFGKDLFRKLEELVDTCQELTQKWHRKEPRIWSLPIRGWLKTKNFFSKLTKEAPGVGKDFLKKGVENFLSEKRISAREAKRLKDWLESEEAKPILRHLGVHVVITLIPFMRLGLGSLARFFYTMAWRIKTFSDYKKGKISKTHYQQLREVHGFLVMAFTLLPGIGSTAYIFARPVRRNRNIFYIACDLFLRKVLRGWYEKLRIAFLVDTLRLVSVEFPLYLFVASWTLGYGAAYYFWGRQWWALVCVAGAAVLISFVVTLFVGIFKRISNKNRKGRMKNKMKSLLAVLSIFGVMWALPVSYTLASKYFAYQHLIMLVGVVIFAASLVGLWLLVSSPNKDGK